jgi:hypothetical protein
VNHSIIWTRFEDRYRCPSFESEAVVVVVPINQTEYLLFTSYIIDKNKTLELVWRGTELSCTGSQGQGPP